MFVRVAAKPMLKPRYCGAVCAALALVFSTTAALGQVGWRTDGTGRYPNAAPPLTWSQDQPIVWKTPLPKWSNASPVIHRKRIFMCQEPATLLCLDLATGKILWEAENDLASILTEEDARKLREDAEKKKRLQTEEQKLRQRQRGLVAQRRQTPKDPNLERQLNDLGRQISEIRKKFNDLQSSATPKTHPVNGYSSPTPVCVDDRVWVLFGTGVTACYDLNGTRIWARFVHRPLNAWGHSASPIVAGGKLIVHIAEVVTALDLKTGEKLWETRSRSWWGTPLALDIGGESAILTTGSDVIRAADGAIVDKNVGAMPWASPIVHDGVVYIVDHRDAFAYRLPAALGDKVTLEKLWQAKPKADRYYASPVFHDGLVYGITQRGHFSVLDAADGSLVYDRRLKLSGTAYPSICLAGDKLFVTGDSGQTLVLAPGREYRELASNKLEPFRSSPVFSGSRLYIRGLKNMYCIGR